VRVRSFTAWSVSLSVVSNLQSVNTWATTAVMPTTLTVSPSVMSPVIPRIWHPF
jgi:hypothetical protein